MANEDLITLATKAALAHGLDPALVCSVAEHESNWDANAIRYEPIFFRTYVAPLYVNNKINATEAYSRGFSWGLMQVMGEVAREMGFGGKYLSKLCDPTVGLEFGCRKLKACVDRHPGDLRAALLKWNGGADATYPDHVLQLMEKYQPSKV